MPIIPGDMSSVRELELRNSTRFPLHFPLAVTIASEEHHGEVIDISAGGVLFQVGVAMQVESAVELAIELPCDALGLDSAVSVRCQARVVRCSAASGVAGHQVAVAIEEYRFERLYKSEHIALT
jgi:hypothetical protein